MPDDAIVIELTAAALVGASIGAFAATAAIRLADERNPWRGRSCCDHCRRRLSVLETLPILGFLISQGKCRTCQGQIDPLHTVSEVLGLTLLPLCLWLRPGLDGLILGALAMLLLTTAIVDLRAYRLLDVFTVPIAAVSALIALRRHELGVGLLASALSALILYVLKLVLEKKRRKSMLGWGDVKLVAALALGLCDWTPTMMLIAACLGLAVVPIRSKFKGGARPFGPMLSAATMFIYLVMKDHF